MKDKVDKKVELTPLELDFFCNAVLPGMKGNYLFCQEYHFKDYYLRSLNYRKVPVGFELTDAQLDELDEMASSWHFGVVLVTNHPAKTLQNIGKETRDEIKKMLKEFRYNGYLVQSFLYQAKLKRILLMSRFIHFKVVHDFFLGYNPKEIIISSIFGDVLFDDYSLSHILFRHFAAGEKQYVPTQSFFGEDIQITSIHRLISVVLGWISKRKVLTHNPVNSAISFKYKSNFYQLFINRAFIQKKGIKANIPVLRVKSLFPINDPAILKHISILKSHKVSEHLTLFEQL